MNLILLHVLYELPTLFKTQNVKKIAQNWVNKVNEFQFTQTFELLPIFLYQKIVKKAKELQIALLEVLFFGFLFSIYTSIFLKKTLRLIVVNAKRSVLTSSPAARSIYFHLLRWARQNLQSNSLRCRPKSIQLRQRHNRRRPCHILRACEKGTRLKSRKIYSSRSENLFNLVEGEMATFSWFPRQYQTTWKSIAKFSLFAKLRF